MSSFMFFGIKDGKPVAAAWKLEGQDSAKINAKLISRWVNEGMEIETVHENTPRFRELRDGFKSNV